MRQLIEDLISAMEYHVEQTRPIHSTTVALQAARDALKPLPAQEPVAWVWNPAKEAWEQVRAFGHWQQGAIYAFGLTPPAAPVQDDMPMIGCVNHDCDKCKAAEKQEPVAEIVEDNFSRQVKGIGKWYSLPNGTKLYTAPPAAQRQWVGLTDEQISEIAAQGHQRWIEFARAIEAAHGIKGDA